MIFEPHIDAPLRTPLASRLPLDSQICVVPEYTRAIPFLDGFGVVFETREYVSELDSIWAIATIEGAVMDWFFASHLTESGVVDYSILTNTRGCFPSSSAILEIRELFFDGFEDYRVYEFDLFIEESNEQ